MQKIQPAKNDLNMDFLNTFDKTIGTQAPAAKPSVTEIPETTKITEEVTEIDATDMNTDFVEEISIDDDIPASKNIKATQIVVRTTEKEREALKAYFMKHGVSLSKGIKIAIRYLEQQEKRGKVHFSDIGISDIGL